MKMTIALNKLLIIMAALFAMAVIASIAVSASDGPGQHLVIDSSNRVVGVVVDGAIVAVNPQLALKAPTDYSGETPTILIKRQQVLTEPRSWNPEPAACPRGVKVMRYGSWGC